MSSYAAHIIMFVELKDESQERFPVWENLVLIEANSEDAAFEKAERYGRAEEGDDGGSFHWGKSPARWVFAGVRKLTQWQTVSNRPEDGTELTYTELELESREDVKGLASGKPVQAYFKERYRPAEPKASKVEGEARPKKRKRA
ncbi:MAG: DUF4288 domain-containing protein [Pirellulales bacterium]